jgi:2-(1,2-epoxy-1,2-dihydrophenyl)acetyl-CoA isomerase
MTDTRTTSFDSVNLHERGPVAMVEIDSVPRRNALGPKVVRGLQAAAAALAARRGTPQAARCILLTGAGTVFCSGGDIAAGNEVMQARARGEDVDVGDFTIEAIHGAIFALRGLDCPLVAAVNGPAIGMGLSLALAGDLIVAARSAVFSALFVRLGMGAEAGVSWRLPRAIGEVRAREMLILGERVPAETALDWGLVNRVFDDEGFREQAWAFAAQAARGGPLAIAQVRRLADSAWTTDYAAQVADETETGARLARTSDAREAFQAFAEKRPPRFQGR